MSQRAEVDDGSSDLVLFSWNVHHSQAAIELACEYLASTRSFVATFQEVPAYLDDAFLTAKAGGKLVVVRGSSSR